MICLISIFFVALSRCEIAHLSDRESQNSNQTPRRVYYCFKYAASINITPNPDDKAITVDDYQVDPRFKKNCRRSGIHSRLQIHPCTGELLIFSVSFQYYMCLGFHNRSRFHQANMRSNVWYLKVRFVS